MPLLAIYNPVCGDGCSENFYQTSVLPLLGKNGKVVDKALPTDHPEHAGEIIIDFLEKFEGDVTVILLSGDGTLHEIINSLSAAQFQGPRASAPPSRLHFVLVPCGTANALYSSLFPPPSDPSDPSYKLKSLQAFIDGSTLAPLTLSITTLSYPPSQRKTPKVTVSAVVTSTCLHAAILHDSESLRKEHPGIERFKIAAQKNSTRWYNSYAKFLPAPGAGVVQLYDHHTKSFIDHPESDENDILDMYGPFAYFLSTVNVDRLEPAFRITPLANDIPPNEATLDVVVVRPLRDPSQSWDTPEARDMFVPKLWAVMEGAYKNGIHTGLQYNEKGEIVTEGDGPSVVEYIRCGGWEWIPDDLDDGAHLLCSDGAISIIEKNGRAVANAAKPREKAGFMVHV